MKFLILLVVVAAAAAQSYVPQDTPEVAAAKAAHLAELAKAGLAAGVPYYPRGSVSYPTPVVKPDGFIADTPEVAAAKAAHFAYKAQAAAAARASPEYSPAAAPAAPAAPAAVFPFFAPAPAPVAFVFSSPSYKYAVAQRAQPPAPAASPVVITRDGFVADTPEVFAAKVAHHHAHIDRLLGIN